jgi:hypothetical protein
LPIRAEGSVMHLAAVTERFARRSGFGRVHSRAVLPPAVTVPAVGGEARCVTGRPWVNGALSDRPCPRPRLAPVPSRNPLRW